MQYAKLHWGSICTTHIVAILLRASILLSAVNVGLIGLKDITIAK